MKMTFEEFEKINLALASAAVLVEDALFHAKRDVTELRLNMLLQWQKDIEKAQQLTAHSNLE